MIRTLRVCESHSVCAHAWLRASVDNYWLCTTYFLTGSSSQQHFCYLQGIKWLKIPYSWMVRQIKFQEIFTNNKFYVRVTVLHRNKFLYNETN